MIAKVWLGASLLWLPASAVLAEDAAAVVTGLQRDVTYAEYSPLSRSLEVARRTLSPLANAEIGRVSAQVRPQAIDLAQERFTTYVPAQRPPQGYGLLVFIAPWEDARVPLGWAPVLDQSGLIFVSAAKSGNEENIIDRRIPLALLGAYNVMQRYPIDMDRVYISGFSGGSRVAMRTALAYPDLFRGALLNAGSDPIGGGVEAHVPPADLFAQFQSSSRLVYVTGSDDSWNMDHDMASRDSMKSWCAFNTFVETMLKVGHEAATTYALRRAVAQLDQRKPVDAEKLAACRARIAKDMALDLQHVADLMEQDKPHDAWRSLTKLDARYGGLAAADSVQLEQRIGSRR